MYEVILGGLIVKVRRGNQWTYANNNQAQRIIRAGSDREAEGLIDRIFQFTHASCIWVM